MFGRCACSEQTCFGEGSSHHLFSEWTFWSYPELSIISRDMIWAIISRATVNMRCLLFNGFHSDFLHLTYWNRRRSGSPNNTWPYLPLSAAVLAQVPWGLALRWGLKHSVMMVLGWGLSPVDVSCGGCLHEDLVPFQIVEVKYMGCAKSRNSHKKLGSQCLCTFQIGLELPVICPPGKTGGKEWF